jgi:hypothetical protein
MAQRTLNRVYWEYQPLPPPPLCPPIFYMASFLVLNPDHSARTLLALSRGSRSAPPPPRRPRRSLPLASTEAVSGPCAAFPKGLPARPISRDPGPAASPLPNWGTPRLSPIKSQAATEHFMIPSSGRDPNCSGVVAESSVAEVAPQDSSRPHPG